MTGRLTALPLRPRHRRATCSYLGGTATLTGCFCWVAPERLEAGLYPQFYLWLSLRFAGAATQCRFLLVNGLQY